MPRFARSYNVVALVAEDPTESIHVFLTRLSQVYAGMGDDAMRKKCLVGRVAVLQDKVGADEGVEAAQDLVGGPPRAPRKTVPRVPATPTRKTRPLQSIRGAVRVHTPYDSRVVQKVSGKCATPTVYTDTRNSSHPEYTEYETTPTPQAPRVARQLFNTLSRPRSHAPVLMNTTECTVRAVKYRCPS